MEVKWDKIEEKRFINLRVERDGRAISPIIPHFSNHVEGVWITSDWECKYSFHVLGDFVFLESCSRDDYVNWDEWSVGLQLCFFELSENPLSKLHSGGTTDDSMIWKNVEISKSSIQSAIVHAGAVFLTDLNYIGEWAERSTKGRWLFPHPDGSRKAHEHMRKTTLKDDFHRLANDILKNPRLQETFQEL